MRKLLFFIFACMPLLCAAQSEWERPLTPAERLEQAKKAEAEAKKAKKEAKKAAKEERKKQKKAAATMPQTAVAAPQTGGEWTKPQPAIKSERKAAEPAKIKNPEDAKYLTADAVPTVDGKVVFTLDLDVPQFGAQEIYDRVYNYLDKLAQESNQIESGVALVNKSERIIAAKYNEWLEFSKSFISLDRTKFIYTIIARCTDKHLTLTLERISYSYEENRDGGFKSTAEKLITNEYAVNKKGTKLQPGTAKFRRKTIDRKDQIFNDIKSLFK